VAAEKRTFMVVGAAIAAAFALPGCAPAGYRAADYGGAQPAANAVDATPSAGAGTANDNGADATEVPDDEVTASLTGTSVKRMGEVVENAKGFVFYRFDKDTAKPTSTSACAGDCAKVWPPALTNDGEPKLKGVDKDLVGTVTRADGSKQLTIGGWPIYTYIGDKPGTWAGQNVAGTWFVIKTDGTKNLTCLPAVSKPVAPPKDDSGADAPPKDDSGAVAPPDDSSDDAGSSGSDFSY